MQKDTVSLIMNGKFTDSNLSGSHYRDFMEIARFLKGSSMVMVCMGLEMGWVVALHVWIFHHERVSLVTFLAAVGQPSLLS